MKIQIKSNKSKDYLFQPLQRRIMYRNSPSYIPTQTPQEAFQAHLVNSPYLLQFGAKAGEK